jgi:hypothetical protein
MAEKNLESSLRKIETYIMATEKMRDQEWRAAIAKKLDEIENRITKQDLEKRTERRMSNGRMLLAAGLPILAVGLGMFAYGALNIDRYFESFRVFSSSELYMLIIGIVMVWIGFIWSREPEY